MAKSLFTIVAVLLVLCISDSVCCVTMCNEEDCDNDPNGPLVNCTLLPDEFLICETPLLANTTKSEISEKALTGYCNKFGGTRYGVVENTSVMCRVLPGIHCFGSRTFLKHDIPCIKYTGHYFPSTLLYSVLLGFLGVDRFCLGHTVSAVFKMISVGGVGVWWITDILLLISGNLTPSDDSNWNPYY